MSEEPSSKMPQKAGSSASKIALWIFVIAMGVFAIYNAYMALKEFGVI